MPSEGRIVAVTGANGFPTSADTPEVVESIPGWTHDVTNVGKEMMVSLVWANEVFDQARPDTVAMPV